MSAENTSTTVTTGSTELHTLAKSKSQASEDKASLLLDAGADLEAKDENGLTPLYVATIAMSSRMVRLFLARNAEIFTLGNGDYNITPIEFILKKQKEVSDDDKDSLDIIKKYFIQANHTRYKSSDEDTYLNVAIYSMLQTKYDLRTEGLVLDMLDPSNDSFYSTWFDSPKKIINTVNEDGHTALHVACVEGHERLVAALLAAGANPNIKGNKGLTPMLIALRLAQKEESTIAVLCHLIQANVDLLAELTLKDCEQQSLIELMAAHCSRKVFEFIAAKDSNVILNYRSAKKGGYSLLHVAALLNDADDSPLPILCRILGADVLTSFVNDWCRTPLQVAITNDKRKNVGILLNSGANAHYKSIDMPCSAYEWAKECAQRSETKRLILKDIEDYLALHPAESNTTTTTSSATKFNQNIFKIAGYTALHAVAESKSEESLDRALRLINAGADINARDERGLSPLDLATMVMNLRMVRLFLENNAKIFGTGNDFNPIVFILDKLKSASSFIETEGFGMMKIRYIQALHRQLARSDKDTYLHTVIYTLLRDDTNLKTEGLLLDMLDPNNDPFYRRSLNLAPRAQINELSGDGITVLQLVCTARKENLVAALLAAGADPNIKDNNGRTALMAALALEQDNDVTTAIVCNLISANADLFHEIKSKNDERYPCIEYMAANCNRRVFNAIADKDINIILNYRTNPRKGGYTLAHLAAMKSHINDGPTGVLCSFLGPNVLSEPLDGKQRTPLHVAVLSQNRSEVVFMMFLCKADPHFKSSSCEFSPYEVAKALADEGEIQRTIFEEVEAYLAFQRANAPSPRTTTTTTTASSSASTSYQPLSAPRERAAFFNASTATYVYGLDNGESSRKTGKKDSKQSCCLM